MTRSIALVSCVLALIVGDGFAQSFPSKPISLNCSCTQSAGSEQYLPTLAQIASKYAGQPVIAGSSGDGMLAGLENLAKAPPDGYRLSLIYIAAFRFPHIQRVSWDPIKDFTYVIGLAQNTIGVVVKSDSQFKTLKDLIDYAKANPGKLQYGALRRGNTAPLAMEELGLEAGVRFRHVPFNSGAESARALIDGRVMAIADTAVWRSQVEAGAFRLLVTFGERRTKWNAPTAIELGFDVLSYAPIGIVGPKGMDPKVTRLLHDAFYRSLDDPEYDKLLKQLDWLDWYKSSEDYAEWAVDQFEHQRKLLARTNGVNKN